MIFNKNSGNHEEQRTARLFNSRLSKNLIRSPRPQESGIRGEISKKFRTKFRPINMHRFDNAKCMVTERCKCIIFKILIGFSGSVQMNLPLFLSLILLLLTYIKIIAIFKLRTNLFDRILKITH
jgi:hypothetical protein